VHPWHFVRFVLVVVLSDAKGINPEILNSEPSAHGDSVTESSGQGGSLDPGLAQVNVVLHSLNGTFCARAPAMTESDVFGRCNVNTLYKLYDVREVLRTAANMQQSFWTPGVFAYVAYIVFLCTCSIPACNQIVCFVASWFQAAVERDFDYVLNT
jgi:hypothetical protein